MTEARGPTGRRAALGVALEAMPAPTSEVPLAVLPVTGAQWQRSVGDANLDGRAALYAARRLDVVSTADCGGKALGRRLRPAALELADAARDLCDRLETLGALEPDDEAPRTALAWRDLIAQDAQAVVTAAIEDIDPPPNPPWPTVPAVATADDRDILFAIFGIAGHELTDDAGSFATPACLPTTACAL